MDEGYNSVLQSLLEKEPFLGKVEEKFFEGEVFSNSSGDTKLENHGQSFPCDQCWFSLQQIKMRRQCQQTRILLQDKGALLLPKCPRPIQDIYFPSRSH